MKTIKASILFAIFCLSCHAIQTGAATKGQNVSIPDTPKPRTKAMMSTVYITSDTTYDTNMTISNDIVVTNGATLTIKSVVTLSSESSISVLSGASIIIDGGTVQNAGIHLNSGSSFSIINSGTVNLLSGELFVVPSNAVMEFNYGVIN